MDSLNRQCPQCGGPFTVPTPKHRKMFCSRQCANKSHSHRPASANSNWRGGTTLHPLYDTYMDMLGRCRRATHHAYSRYGGRGITVCQRWTDSFWNFVEDMGERPPGHSIDRIDNDALGLDIASPIWEFGAIRRYDQGDGAFTEAELHLFIHHDPGAWLDTLREDFVADYSARFDETAAFCKTSAARSIATFLGGHPTLVGAVPDFDTNRIRHQLLEPLGIPEPWHYHLVDVENLIVGYLAGGGAVLPPPWNSNDLSRAIGVDPEKFRRHTAMGDVQWVRAQYDAVMGGHH